MLEQTAEEDALAKSDVSACRSIWTCTEPESAPVPTLANLRSLIKVDNLRICWNPFIGFLTPRTGGTVKLRPTLFSTWEFSICDPIHRGLAIRKHVCRISRFTIHSPLSIRDWIAISMGRSNGFLQEPVRVHSPATRSVTMHSS